jgi:hypothetical protein
MSDYSSLEAIEKRIVESGRPMTRAESSTLAPLRIKRRKDEDARQPKPKSRAEAANIARIGAEKYNELREMSNNPPAPPRTRAEATTYMKNRQMAPATSTPESPVPATAPVPAATTGRAVPAATATAPANQSTKAPSPSYGRSDEAIAEMEAARNQPTSAPSPSYGRSDEAIAEMEAARNQAPKAAAAPQDDIRSMIEAKGNALSFEPVADERPATAPMGNVSTEIGAPKAAPEISEDRMSALFRKTMGNAFDPKSKVDASKMNQLREFVGSNPDLLNKSDTKIALDYYRTLK